MTDDTPRMIAIVEQYLKDKTGNRIKIVFNDPMKIRMHIKMLFEAYLIAEVYNKSK